ncbi:MAG: ABC transporter permease [Bacteroidia bacterium]
MNKILLIIKREYLTRVRKKSFIVMTLLGPLLMGGVFAAIAFIAVQGGDTVSVVKVIDETEGKIFADKLKSTKSVIYETDNSNIDSARAHFNADETYGILYIPNTVINSPNTFILYTEKKANISVVSNIEKDLQTLFEDFKMRGAGIDPKVLAATKTDISIRQTSIQGHEESNAGASAAIGFAGGLLIYIFTFIYGAQVMRGVMEEKQSRIVEVIMSSVKPFQLMMGKIIGIAMVALTQFIMWIILTAVITVGVTAFIAKTSPQMKAKVEQIKSNDMMMDEQSKQTADSFQDENFDINKLMGSFNIPKMIFMFIFYFIGGYLLYSALFAAIGAAVDSETDVQQFMIPITIPLVFAYIAATVVMQNPDSPMGFWFSIIPFTSPIVMMVRMPFDPPIFDIVLSMVLLVLGFIGTTWLAGKIYRTGILMYGKKVNYKELAKWITYKG